MLAIRRLNGFRLMSTTNLEYYTSLDPISPSNLLITRHIGPSAQERTKMLEEIGVTSLDDLIKKTLPETLPRNDLPDWKLKTEQEVIGELESLANANILMKNYLGGGYYGTYTPPVILRNVMQNPGWYTSYTPYQAEISQGRLESLLIYQTMVSNLTGLKVANASLLDEATAGAEAMTMAYLIHNKKKNLFIVSDKVFLQTIAVIKTRAEPLGIEVLVTDVNSYDFKSNNIFGVLVQSPDKLGEIKDFTKIADIVHSVSASLIIGSDLLALCLMKSPGEMGADICYGNSQRFGVPLGYGGPHAAFFSSQEEHIRKMPGRIIGVSKDKLGGVAYRMTMQTREQHIRREKATSNICTAQALLANMAGLYSVYHGPEGLKSIASRVYMLAHITNQNLTNLGYTTYTNNFFDTISINNVNSNKLLELFEKNGINIRKQDTNTVSLSFDETTTLYDVEVILKIFSQANNSTKVLDLSARPKFPEEFLRSTPILTHSIYNSIHSESQMLRYLHRLQRKDISLANSMIPLGSCTMKLNATSEMIPVTFAGFSSLHPHVPLNQAKGYTKLIENLREKLKIITGFDEISFQPNSGAQGEYAGLISIRNYFKHHQQLHRKVCLIPTSAHGTNPASASMAGMTVVPVSCDKSGNISIEDIKEKAEKYKNELGAMMVTYPSTHGVFEKAIVEAIDIVHHFGGQVYMDGANMNAQVGLTSPGHIGADVCHLNLHKTFAIPHGGGGPGMGPIGVKSHLSPFLPRDFVLDLGGTGGQISSSHFASASILPISWAYIESLGSIGLAESSKHAILNANYIRKRLEKYYNIVYVGHNGQVAHELLIDLRGFKYSAEVTEEDVAKRLMDFGFHSPTMSFPISGTLMIEPTESEDKGELDRLCDALIKIREEIHEIESGLFDKKNNVLKNAPHSLEEVIVLEWNKPYTRQKAAYPLPWIKVRGKYWPTISRVDNVWGDKYPNTHLPEIDFYV
jgi:glycine dehydrogenase